MSSQSYYPLRNSAVPAPAVLLLLIPGGVILSSILYKFHVQWLQSVNTFVPHPYLDEVFHIPQAQAYWAGEWSRWDPKITTPPGLYVFSYLANSVGWGGSSGGGQPDQTATAAATAM